MLVLQICGMILRIMPQGCGKPVYSILCLSSSSLKYCYGVTGTGGGGGEQLGPRGARCVRRGACLCAPGPSAGGGSRQAGCCPVGRWLSLVPGTQCDLPGESPKAEGRGPYLMLDRPGLRPRARAGGGSECLRAPTKRAQRQRE